MLNKYPSNPPKVFLSVMGWALKSKLLCPIHPTIQKHEPLHQSLDLRIEFLTQGKCLGAIFLENASPPPPLSDVSRSGPSFL